MIDFARLARRTPEEREASRKELERKFEVEQKRNELMIDKLYDQMSRGCIDNTWAEGFIESVHNKVHSGLLYLTDKQQQTLEKLFEQY